MRFGSTRCSMSIAASTASTHEANAAISALGSKPKATNAARQHRERHAEQRAPRDRRRLDELASAAPSSAPSGSATASACGELHGRLVGEQARASSLTSGSSAAMSDGPTVMSELLVTDIGLILLEGVAAAIGVLCRSRELRRPAPLGAGRAAREQFVLTRSETGTMPTRGALSNSACDHVRRAPARETVTSSTTTSARCSATSATTASVCVERRDGEGGRRRGRRGPSSRAGETRGRGRSSASGSDAAGRRSRRPAPARSSDPCA